MLTRGLNGDLAGPRTPRDRNLALMLGEIVRNGPLTRAGLAETTGLGRRTVSALVSALAEGGFVHDGGRMRDSAGRSGLAVTVKPAGPSALGLHVEADGFSSQVRGLGGYSSLEKVHAQNRDRPAEDVFTDLGKLAKRLIRYNARHWGRTVAAVTVALPGVLDERARCTAPGFGWSGVPVTDLLQSRLPKLPLPVEFGSEDNLAALGEMRARDADLGDVLFVSSDLSVGIGSVIITGGGVFRGAHGPAEELGHLPLDPDGPPCSCGGRGCLEQVAGVNAVLRSAGLAEHRRSLPDLVTRLKDGDAAAVAAVERAGEALGTALGATARVVNPDTILFGGLLYGRLRQWMVEPFESALRAARGRSAAAAPRLAFSSLGPAFAAASGAAAASADRILTDPAALLPRTV